jgi:HAD superfamily PSPase-like hydrolase
LITLDVGAPPITEVQDVKKVNKLRMKGHSMKVVVFDMDGTLISESSWELLHHHFHADTEQVKLNREAYFSGLIDYETWMEKDMVLWNAPSLEDIKEGLASFTLEPNSGAVVEQLKEKGIISCIVSSVIDILAEKIGKKLGIEPVLIFANKIILEDGTLKGLCVVEPYRKDRAVRQLSQQLGIPLREFAAVGDAAPDISLFKEVALKFTYNPKDETIVNAADYVLNDLRGLLDFF